MIEKLEKYIVKNNLDEFKQLFGTLTINAHHREQLYKSAFLNQNEQFLEFLSNKTSLSKEKEQIFL